MGSTLIATTLASALRDKAIPLNPKGEPNAPYLKLAQIARFEGIPVTLDDAAYATAIVHLETVDRARAQADFTLVDLAGRVGNCGS